MRLALPNRPRFVRLALESLASLEVPTVLEVSHMGFVTALLDTLHVGCRRPPAPVGAAAR